MKFFRAIANLFKGISDFWVSMMTGPHGDISSKRVNGTELIQAAIGLGFFIAFLRTQAVALEVLKLFLYVGAGILGVGNLMENIKIGISGASAVTSATQKAVNSDEGVRSLSENPRL